ncbi:hydrolase 2, exosortase A system-associated [Pseudoduganella sp. RAF53_2]|uniref:hydrolase 2, exosortase A system-associated n=1 Tax=unclassified Pseudoduganella TaxID=2637179 RepID=UPI003F9DDBCB
MTTHPAPPAHPFFLDGGAAARFCLYHAPHGPCRGAFIYLHPFAEEMNKARRMAAQQARALAAQGYAILQIDLHGCGDSAGDFSEARWETWLADVARAERWLEQKLGDSLLQPVGLWGLRLGALLALDYARQSPHMPAAMLLWQPVASGQAFLTQFLRLKVAAQMLTDGQQNGGTAALRALLDQGESLEIAGYTLSAELAKAIDSMDATRIMPPLCPIHWFEMVAEPGRPLPPAAARVLQTWQVNGADATGHAVPGPAFWASQEIAEAPALLQATTTALHEAMYAS